MRVPISDISRLSFEEGTAPEAVPLSVFTDPILREAVAQADADGDEQLSEVEIASITELKINYESGLTSLEGINYLTDLTTLNLMSCSGLTEADLSGLEKLEYLQLGFCSNLETLTLGAKPALSEMYVQYTALSELDFSGLTALTECSVASTKISDIEIHNPLLTYFSCGGDALQSVDLSGCDALTTLNLNDASAISSFDIAPFPLLKNFTLTGSKISKFTTEGNPELESLTLTSSENLWQINVSKSLKLSTLSCFGCWELESVIMTEGQIIANMSGVSDWMITYVEREWPDDVAPEISDEAFRAAMLKIADTDGDGKISREEAEAVTTLNASGLGLTNVDFFYFNKIQHLDLAKNELESIDLSMLPDLTYLNVNSNKLTELNVSYQKLEYLYADHNQLTSVKFGGYNYLEIDLSHNALTTLTPYYMSKMLRLDLSYNNLTDVTLTGNDSLAFMDLSHNQLKSVRMWSLKKLVDLKVNDNPFTELDDSKNWTILETINCSNTDITTLNLSESTELKECIATGCANLETIYVAEDSAADITKDDNTTVVFGAPAE